MAENSLNNHSINAPSYIVDGDPGRTGGGTYTTPSTGRMDPTIQDYENIFGPAARDVKLDLQRHKRHGRWHLPDALKGSNPWIADKIDGLITDTSTSPFTTTILPYMYIENVDQKIKWNRWSFDEGLSSRVPYESAARTLTQTKTSYAGYTVRQGLAMTLEHNFMMSPKGRENFKHQLQQIVGSIQYTNDIDVHVALITAPSYAKEKAEKYFTRAKTNHQVIREYIDLFGFFQKNPNAMDIMIEEGKSVLRSWGALEPSFLLTNSKLTFQMTMLPERTEYITQGPDGQKRLKSGPEVGSYRGLKVINSRAFSMEDGAPPRDVLRRRVRTAEYYRIPYTAGVEKKFFSFYDEAKDAWQRFSWHDLLRMADCPQVRDEYNPADYDYSEVDFAVTKLPDRTGPDRNEALNVEHMDRHNLRMPFHTLNDMKNPSYLTGYKIDDTPINGVADPWQILHTFIGTKLLSAPCGAFADSRQPALNVVYAAWGVDPTKNSEDHIDKYSELASDIYNFLTGNTRAIKVARREIFELIDFYDVADMTTFINDMFTGTAWAEHPDQAVARGLYDNDNTTNGGGDIGVIGSNVPNLNGSRYCLKVPLGSGGKILTDATTGNPILTNGNTPITAGITNVVPHRWEIVVIRPNIEHEMLGIIMGRGGVDELGATLWGQTELSVYDDSMHGIWGMSYKYNERAIVFNHKNMIRLWDVAYDGYNGGKSCDHVEWRNPEDVGEFMRNTYELNRPYEGKSMMVMKFRNVDNSDPWPSPIVFHEAPGDASGGSTGYMDGEHQHQVDKKNFRVFDRPYYQADYQNYVNQMPNFTRMHNTKNAGNMSEENETSCSCLAFQGTMRIHDEKPGYEEISGNGHHGIDAVGMASVRSGKGIAMGSLQRVGAQAMLMA